MNNNISLIIIEYGQVPSNEFGLSGLLSVPIEKNEIKVT